MTDYAAPPRPHTEGESGESMPAGVARFFRSPVRVVGAAVAAVLLIDAGGTDSGAGLCVFRRCTGGYCPGCGLTRSARHLTRGEIAAAWTDHPWLVLVAAQAVVAASVWSLLHFLGRRIDVHRALLAIGILNVPLSLGIWIVRLADGSIPRFY
jgi:hypothetical protein